MQQPRPCPDKVLMSRRVGFAESTHPHRHLSERTLLVVATSLLEHQLAVHLNPYTYYSALAEV